MQIYDGRILFIGAGNMAEALIQGLLKSGIAAADRIRVTDIQLDRIAHFLSTYGVGGSSDNAAEAQSADLIVLAVKPQTLPALLQSLRPALGAQQLLLSIAAGIPIAAIRAAAGDAPRIVRSMPNTPALVGKGVAAICGDAADLDTAELILSAAGTVVRVEEEQMDAVTAISGSGPAYAFYLMEAMQEAADRLGLEKATADQLISATIEGAGALVRQTGEAPATLRARVTSKGGTTEAAINVMQEEDLHDHLVTAIMTAHQRARELAAGG